MKLLIISPHNILSGEYTFSETLAQFFRGKKYKLFYLILFKIDNRNKFQNRSLEPRSVFSDIQNDLSLLKLSYQKLKNYLDEKNPEIIIGIGIKVNFLLALLRIVYQYKYRLIFTHHKTTNFDKANLLRFKSLCYFIFKFTLLSVLFRFVDLVVTPSKGLRDELRSKFKLSKYKCINVYNGIDSKRIDKLKKIAPQEKNTVKIIKKCKLKIFSLGRLSWEKDYSILIQSFKEVLKTVPEANLFIIGTGPEYLSLKQLCQQLKVNNQVYFIGAAKNPYYYLKFADVYAQTSRREVLSYSLLEAMTLGKPVVATDCKYGNNEILDNGKYGILVPVGDIKRVAGSIGNLLANKKIHKKYSYLSKYRSNFFQADKMGNEYKQIANRLLSSSR